MGYAKRLATGILFGSLMCAASGARAESARFYELEGFGHFLDGNPESTAVTEEGAIALPPDVKERFSDAAAAFSAATTQGDDVIVAQVDDCQVLAVDKAGHTRKIFKPDAALVSAMLATEAGLLVAAGPPAKLYRVGKNGEAKVFYTPEAAYIWAMAPGPDGSVYAVTGEPGTVVKIDKEGRGKVLFKPEQAHLRSVAYDAKMGLFVGGGERGVVYRANKNDEDFRALFDTGNPEVTAILAREGSVYVAGVTGAALLAQEDGKRAGGKPSDVHSQVMRVAMDGTSEVLAGSSDEAVFALAFDNQHNVVVATGATGRDDPRGRVYSIDPTRRVISMLYQSPSRRITHLVTLASGDVLAAITAAGGRIVQFTGTAAKKGDFLTQAFDTGINSKFGLVQALGVYPKGTEVAIAVRTGQTAEPDATWSPWSKAVIAPGNRAVDVANGRYLQLRVTLSGNGSATPLVQRVRLAYLRQNLPPFVREVSALRKGVALTALPHDEAKVKTVSLGEKPDEHGDELHRAVAPARVRQSLERGALTIKWQADDPNGDELRYELFMRSANEATWRLLKGDLEDPFFTLKSTQLPDGYYIFRVRAQDNRSNPDGLERSDARESRAVLVDNTPPQISGINVSVKGGNATLRAKVSDAVGPLLELSYALDSGEPRPVLPQDGVLDGPTEEVVLELHDLKPGNHTLTLRALDEADNEGFGEAQFTIKP